MATAGTWANAVREDTSLADPLHATRQDARQNTQQTPTAASGVSAGSLAQELALGISLDIGN